MLNAFGNRLLDLLLAAVDLVGARVAVRFELGEHVEGIVPRLADAPFALECRQHVALAFGPDRELLIGEVLRLHAREGLIDREKMYVDFDTYRPIGRLFGNLYASQRNTFSMARESHAQWRARSDAADKSQ